MRHCACPARAVASRVDDVRRAPPRLTLVGATAVVVIVLDQITKWWAVRAMAYHSRAIGPIHLTLSHNKGAAFGLGAGFVPIVALAAIGVVVVAIIMGRATSRPVTAVAAGMLLGGALGNLADRLFRSPGALRGAVVDFVDLRFWPVFNLADSAITIGCVLLVLFAGASSRAHDA
jgi:signal peptidase II